MNLFGPTLGLQSTSQRDDRGVCGGMSGHLEHVRTLNIPIQSLITKRELCVLNKDTARLTRPVRLLCEASEEVGVPRPLEYIRRYFAKTGISASLIRQAEDQTSCIWYSYMKLQKNCELMMKETKKRTAWSTKFLKRARLKQNGTTCKTKNQHDSSVCMKILHKSIFILREDPLASQALNRTWATVDIDLKRR